MSLHRLMAACATLFIFIFSSCKDPLKDILARSPLPARHYRLIKQEEFNGASAEARTRGCFSGPARCVDREGITNNEVEPRSCPPETQAALADLDRCSWTVLQQGNNNVSEYRAADGSIVSQKINGFHPSQVEVKNGFLYLKAAYKNAPVNTSDPLAYPIWSGAIISRSYPNKPGIRVPLGQSDLADYGRIEGRMRISWSKGSWPAFWMIADHEAPLGSDPRAKWPYLGEIDIFETWANAVGQVQATQHGASEADPARHLMKILKRSVLSPNDFYTFSIEYEPSRIRFFLGSFFLGEVIDGDTIMENGKPYSLRLPRDPFMLYLNLAVERFFIPDLDPDSTKPSVPDPTADPELSANYRADPLVVDYIRLYQACVPGTADCVEFN